MVRKLLRGHPGQEIKRRVRQGRWGRAEEEQRALLSFTLLPSQCSSPLVVPGQITGPPPRAISRAVPQLDAHALRTNMATFIPDEHIQEFLRGQTIAQLEEAGGYPALLVYARVG